MATNPHIETQAERLVTALDEFIEAASRVIAADRQLQRAARKRNRRSGIEGSRNVRKKRVGVKDAPET